MRGALVLAAGAALLLAASGSQRVALGRAVSRRLALSPLVAWWVSQPPRPAASARVSEATAAEFRRIARRTWAYFERFAGAESHGLPADNFQEEPQPEVARRTSPTNVGLGAARDRRGQRLRMDRNGRDGRAPRGRVRHDRTPRALPRPPLQLVRHDRPCAARAALRLHGRQRQPRRAPDRAQAGLPRARWTSRSSSGRALDGHRRHARSPARRPRRRSPAAAPGRVVTSRQLEAALARGRARCSRRCPATRPSGPRASRRSRSRAETLVDIVLALVQDDGSPEAGPALAWARGAARLRREPCARRPRRRDESLPPAEPLRGAPGRPRRDGRPPGRRRWTSRSCTTRRGSSSRSAIVRRRERSTPATTTCSPRRRAWRASSRSRAATCRSSTGSTSAGP